jgi:hypothetical protein
MQDKSKSNNAGAEVGVGVSVGAQTGVYVYAEASVGSSKSNSDSSTWQNTELTGKNISLKAEGDTTLRGATATADRIDVKTGGTLTIESLQDIAESMSKDSQVGGRVQVSFGTAWDVSGNASASKANGSYKAVGQQSGLFAGDGGYHVDAGHVNLIGGAIASTNAANSELTAETFTFTDLKNEMDYRASSASISGGFGSTGNGAKDANGNPTAAPGVGGQLKDIGNNVTNGMYGSANTSDFSGGVPITTSGSDSSTTYATLTEGNITIGGKKVTAEELGVNTDASKAHEAISTLPDLQKLMQEQQAMSSAAGTVVATSKQVAGDIAAAKSNAAANAYFNSLGSEKAKAEFLAMSPEAQRDALMGDDGYREAQKWATGGSYSRALDAVTTAIVGSVAGQGGGQVASNALAPYAAQFIGSQFDPNHGANPDATLQLISHALLGALLAEANGGSAGNGALAAGGGELAAKFITGYLYGGDPSKLSEEEKQNVLALSQAVGALAGGLGGEGLVGAAAGANIARNSVENNWLSDVEWDAYQKAKMECTGDNPKSCGAATDYENLSMQRDQGRYAYINAARDALIADGYKVTQDMMGEIDKQYWKSQGIDTGDARFLGINVQATSKGAYQKLTEFYANVAAETDNPGNWVSTTLTAGILNTIGQTWGAWTGINPANGQEVVGVEAWDGRFLTIVDAATAAIMGGTGGPRTVGKSLLQETTGDVAERAAAKNSSLSGVLPDHMLPDNILGDGLAKTRLVEDLIDAANKPVNNTGLSAAARAWEKHAEREAGVFEVLKGNVASKNQSADSFVREVLGSKDTAVKQLSKGGVEYRLPDGRGIRFNKDGSISGFLDPRQPKN